MKSNQETSIFFTLPIEIRHEVYKFCVPFLQKNYLLNDFHRLAQGFNRGDSPSILRTCKRIHEEAKPILSSFVTVVLKGPLNPSPGKPYRPSIIRTINPFKLSSVRHLRIELEPRYWTHNKIYRLLGGWRNDVKELSTIHVHFSKPMADAYGYMLEGEQYDLVVAFTYSIVGSCLVSLADKANVQVVTLSGYRADVMHMPWNALDASATKVKLPPKVLYVSDDGATQELSA